MLHYCYLSSKNNETALIIRSGSRSVLELLQR
nr:MAG TPA: hypothetical protein [Caudoviricetes sp.]